jgi:hypothetical protein
MWYLLRQIPISVSAFTKRSPCLTRFDIIPYPHARARTLTHAHAQHARARTLAHAHAQVGRSHWPQSIPGRWRPLPAGCATGPPGGPDLSPGRRGQVAGPSEPGERGGEKVRDALRPPGSAELPRAIHWASCPWASLTSDPRAWEVAMGPGGLS